MKLSMISGSAPPWEPSDASTRQVTSPSNRKLSVRRVQIWMVALRRVVAVIFEPPPCADDRVVPAGVRRVEALLVAGHDAVGELHVDHVDILHLDDRVELLLLERRPVVRLPDRRNALSDPFLSRRAAWQLVVDGEIAHAVDPHRARSGQEVDHVDIVRALLQQQAVAVRLSGVQSRK